MISDVAAPSVPEVLKLVADPHRWQLLRELAGSDLRVGELVERLAKPQNLVSYHLAELRRAGLVSGRRSSADGRDTYYRVELRRCGELLCATGAALSPGLRLGVLPAESPRPQGGRAPVVLFLCTGNSARSQMAEALLEHLRAMAERGIHISGRPTKHLSRFARTRFDRVITLCDKVLEICPEFPGRPATAHWSMADPAAEADTDEGSYPAFLRTAAELETRIPLLITELSSRPRGGTDLGT